MKVLTRTDLSGLVCSATFDQTERYRYDLTWRWSASPLMACCGLNPSTATHEVLDPTIRGLIARARAWGFGGLRMLNLFGLRATDPRAMLAHPEPIGEHNDLVIRAALAQLAGEGFPLIAAWGKHGQHRARDRAVVELARQAGVPLHAFRRNQDGSPMHPPYIPLAERPSPWTPPERDEPRQR